MAMTQKRRSDNYLESVAAVDEPEGVGAKVATLVLREEEVDILIFVLVLRNIKNCQTLRLS